MPPAAPETTRAQKIRAGTVAAVLLALFAALGWRLYAIQVADADHWRALAVEQQRPNREAAQVRGVSFRSEYRRVYPSGPLAAHVVGFTGLTREGELYGLTGVESVLEKELAGVKGLRESVRDGAGRGLLEEGRIELPPED